MTIEELPELDSLFVVRGVLRFGTMEGACRAVERRIELPLDFIHRGLDALMEGHRTYSEIEVFLCAQSGRYLGGPVVIFEMRGYSSPSYRLEKDKASV